MKIIPNTYLGILAALGFFVILGGSNQPCRAADWQYQRTLTFDSATTRRDSVVEVALSPEVLSSPYRHINADGSDLRFTTADGTAVLNYWIESWNPTGQSKVWVKVPASGTIKMKYGHPAASSASAGAGVFSFFEDFDNGIWTKHGANPVITRTEPWEAAHICEPSILHEDGIYKMWYMGCATSEGTDAALGYATSPDGLNWTKSPNNPILREPTEAVIRTTVVKRQGTYYLFASDYQWNAAPGNIRRWTSIDGLNWTDKTVVLRPTQDWEDHFHNVGITLDEQGTWHMLYTTDGPMGYASSHDGLNWTKHPQPVVTGFYGGDPYVTKIGDTFYTWHSQAQDGELLIYARKSTDMIHWEMVGNSPQIGYTQPWERAVGRPEVHTYTVHITDAELMEHDGRVWMYYQGVQNPIGVAWFDGTLEQLGAAMKDPPLRQWAASHYHSVEDKQLKVSHNATGNCPVHENVRPFHDQIGYNLQCLVQVYAGYRTEPAPTVDAHPQVSVVMRYRDDNNQARFRLVDDNTTYYEERLDGTWSNPVNIGANNAFDHKWHRWRIDVQGNRNTLYIDDVLIGSRASGAPLCDRTDLLVGVSTCNAFAAFDDLRVTDGGLLTPTITFGAEVP